MYFRRSSPRREADRRQRTSGLSARRMYAAVEGHPPYEDQPNALALLATIAARHRPCRRRAGFLHRADRADARSRPWRPVVHGGRRARARAAAGSVMPASCPARAHHRADAPRDRPVVVPAATPPTGTAQRTAERPAAGHLPLRGVADVASPVPWCWPPWPASWHSPRSSASCSCRAGPPTARRHTDPAGSSPTRQHSATRRLHVASATSRPSDHVPAHRPRLLRTSRPPPGSSRRGGAPSSSCGATTRPCPSRTRPAWSALSPGFQDKIGGYGSYQGFWSTISRVSVGRHQPAGSEAVDVSLTYTRNDGSDGERGTPALPRAAVTGYLITGDSVVG